MKWQNMMFPITQLRHEKRHILFWGEWRISPHTPHFFLWLWLLFWLVSCRTETEGPAAANQPTSLVTLALPSETPPIPATFTATPTRTPTPPATATNTPTPTTTPTFTDEHRHPFFHTNNLWFDLQALSQALSTGGAVLGLPLIRNTKTVDPSDPESPEVFQIETAMGAAIEVFEGAQAIAVGRDRFLPVKTTNDLLLLRSDVYDVDAAGQVTLTVPAAPLIDLDPTYYKTVAQFDERFPAGAPSLREARRLAVEGDWTFGADVVVSGDVTLTDDGEPQVIPAGTSLGDRG